MNDTITIQTTIVAPIDKVWEYWNQPEHIIKWAFASDDWETSSAKNDLRVGGAFSSRMQAKDGSTGFDFEGIYDTVKVNELIEYTMSDGRRVRVEFKEIPEGVLITEAFEAEQKNSAEMQRAGWQAILDNFKKYIENG